MNRGTIMTMLVKEAMEQNLPIILFQGHNGVITLTHDKQWIKAKKDIDTRKEYWISLDDGEIMSHYNYNKEDRYVDIKSVMQWFSNAQIITYDYRFAKIALFNKQSYELKTYSSPIRFIQALGKQSTIYEEWDAAGIKIKELEETLNTYNDIDLGLDTFPFCGFTTTAEALMMGTPVLGVKGNSLLTRACQDILTNANMSEFIANDIDEYFAKAVYFATDGREKLAKFRANAREHIQPLFDSAAFAKNIENMLLQMWINYELGIKLH